jgi:hypothetical protein
VQREKKLLHDNGESQREGTGETEEGNEEIK